MRVLRSFHLECVPAGPFSSPQPTEGFELARRHTPAVGARPSSRPVDCPSITICRFPHGYHVRAWPPGRLALLSMSERTDHDDQPRVGTRAQAEEHLMVARRNEAAAHTNEEPHPEWAVTALFYAALHYVEAYWFVTAAAQGYDPHCTSHEERSPAVAKYLNPIYKHYRALEKASRDARYRAIPFSKYDVQDLRNKRLAPLKQHILQEIQPQKRTPKTP